MTEYTSKLHQLKESEAAALQKKKLKKINQLLDTSNHNITNIWLPDLMLSTTEERYINNNEQICDSIINAGMKILNKDFPHFTFQSSSLQHNLLVYSPTETIHIHHNGEGHFCTSSSIGGEVCLFDSLNTKPSEELLRQLTTIYSPDPDITPTIKQYNITATQRGSVDCGIFALAYATELAHCTNPAMFVYNQESFRPHLLQCLLMRNLQPFPKKEELQDVPSSIDVTRNISICDKWSPPSRSKPRLHHSPLLASPLSSLASPNRFAALSGEVEVAPIDFNINAERNTPSIHNIRSNIRRGSPWLTYIKSA